MTRLINAVGVVDINKADGRQDDGEDKRISWKIAEGRKEEQIAKSERCVRAAAERDQQARDAMIASLS